MNANLKLDPVLHSYVVDAEDSLAIMQRDFDITGLKENELEDAKVKLSRVRELASQIQVILDSDDRVGLVNSTYPYILPFEQEVAEAKEVVLRNIKLLQGGSAKRWSVDVPEDKKTNYFVSFTLSAYFIFFGGGICVADAYLGHLGESMLTTALFILFGLSFVVLGYFSLYCMRHHDEIEDMARVNFLNSLNSELLPKVVAALEKIRSTCWVLDNVPDHLDHYFNKAIEIQHVNGVIESKTNEQTFNSPEQHANAVVSRLFQILKTRDLPFSRWKISLFNGLRGDAKITPFEEFSDCLPITSAELYRQVSSQSYIVLELGDHHINFAVSTVSRETTRLDEKTNELTLGYPPEFIQDLLMHAE